MLTVLVIIYLSCRAAAAGVTTEKLFTQQEVSGMPLARRQNLQWKLQTSYDGPTFFDHFDFFDQPDPTNGLVNYVSRDQAFRDGLAFWTVDGVPGIQAEHWKHTQLNEHRNSVRITSKATFAGGLYVFDIKMFPYGSCVQYVITPGCGIWPALWMLGVDGPWPAGGEIDILEGVHNSDYNQYTLHTAAGCSIGTDTSFTGQKVADNCHGHQGCGIRSSSPLTYGQAFNSRGGGVIAVLWDGDGVRMWDWTRSVIPHDIITQNPSPASWGPPAANFAAAACNPFTYLKPQVMILNIDLCGDWAGSTYPSAPGCPGTCAERIMDPANLENTVMQINSIGIYQLGEASAGGQNGVGADLVQHRPSSGNSRLGEVTALYALTLVYAVLAVLQSPSRHHL